MIRVCQHISLLVNAMLTLLAAAIYAPATGAIAIAPDVTRYESDKMKHKEEQKDFVPSRGEWIVIDIDGPAPERRTSV